MSETQLKDYARLSFGEPTGQHRRVLGLSKVLDWLNSAPGSDWQARWEFQEAHCDWDAAAHRGESSHHRTVWRLGTEALICSRTVTPTWQWLFGSRRAPLLHQFLWINYPGWAALLQENLAKTGVTESVIRSALMNIGRICIGLGKSPSLLTADEVADTYNLARSSSLSRGQLSHFGLAYGALVSAGVFDPDAPPSLVAATRRGRLSPTEIVDRYAIRNAAMRQLFIQYFTEREVSLDYSSVQSLATRLLGAFWGEVQKIDPSASSLRLSDEVWRQWRHRIKHDPSARTNKKRKTQNGIFVTVRSMYMDISDWAQDQPEKWAPYAAPCAISRRELSSNGTKASRQRKSRMDHRTRTLAPLLPRLRSVSLEQLLSVQKLLALGSSIAIGASFEDGTVNWTRVAPSRLSHNIRLRSDDGTTRNLTHEEDVAFWQWAIVEGLSILGPRIEELLELTAFDLVPWRKPDGQTVILLRINPSKTDHERLIPITRDQAAVFATIVRRVKGQDGSVPHVSRYDNHEKVDGPLLPHLFQRKNNGRTRVISYPTVLNLLNGAARAAGLAEPGQPSYFRPHDFRRLFVTEHVNSGLPIHIVAALVGHASLDTTARYAAIYPREVIDAYLAHLSRRRDLRPAGEYETDNATAQAHRKAFADHFGQRVVSSGECIRGFGVPCDQQHNCNRCPLVDLRDDARADLMNQYSKTSALLDEAVSRGWTAEAEGYRLDLSALQRKMDHLVERQRIAAVVGSQGSAGA